MIMGHVGVAFAAKAPWRRIPLTALLLASFAPDILRELLATFHLSQDQVNLYSHGLPWSALLALAVGAAGWAALRDREAFAVLFALVISHIALDMISGRKVLWSHGPQGINASRNAPMELLIEGALLFGGWLLLRRTPGPRWTRHWSVPSLLLAVLIVSLLGTISQRPYATRCLASPMAACTDASLMTRRWDTAPFW